jgi:phosphoribosylaminoimidazole carboxylase (NCAIR synthetase)
VADEQIVAGYNDEAAIRELGARVDFLTFEIELANAAILDELAAAGVAVNPSARTLGIIKDKLAQKRFLDEHGLPVAAYQEVAGREDIELAAVRFGWPLVLKARFDAYDGRGNAVMRGPEDIEVAMAKLDGRKLYVEQWVPFTKELAVVTARQADGMVATYPVVETIHRNNICHTVIAPARVPEAAAVAAEQLAAAVMGHLEGAGCSRSRCF